MYCVIHLTTGPGTPGIAQYKHFHEILKAKTFDKIKVILHKRYYLQVFGHGG